MKWYRVFLAVMFLSMVACGTPTAPKYPAPDDEKETDPNNKPDPNQGFLISPDSEIVFLV